MQMTHAEERRAVEVRGHLTTLQKQISVNFTLKKEAGRDGYLHGYENVDSVKMLSIKF